MTFFLRVLTGLVAGVAFAGAPVADIVTVSPSTGVISPTGFVASISAIADISSQAAVVAAMAEAAAAAADTASNAVQEVQTIINGLEGIGYIRGYVMSFGAGIESDANLTASIIKFESAGTTSTSSLWRAYTYFTSDPGQWPILRFSQSLQKTNAWNQASQVSVALTNIVVGGTRYEAYANTVAMPLAYTGAFFRAFANVAGAGTNQVFFPVRNGISVNGETPLTVQFAAGTNVFRIIGGIIKRL